MEELRDAKIILNSNNILINSVILTLAILVMIFFIGYLIYNIRLTITMFLIKIFDNQLGLFIANYITFIGTVHHELSHAIIAILTGAKVKEIKLLEFNKGTLGHVTYIPRGPYWLQQIQISLTSIAPIVMGIITNYSIIRFIDIRSLSVVYKCLLYYIIFSIITHMSMSRQDIKIGLKGLPVCIVIIYSISLIILQ